MRRVCEHCGTKFDRGYNRTRKFCPHEVMDDGSIKSCKDDYHNERKRPGYHLTKDLMRLCLAYANIFSGFYEDGIYDIDLEELNRLKIDLTHFQPSPIANSQFHRFKLLNISLEQIDTDKFKIHKLK